MGLAAVSDVLAVAGAAVLLGFLAVVLLGMARRGPLAKVTARREEGLREEVTALARSRGWWVGQGDEVSRRVPDQRLAADRAHPTRCVQVVDGAADGFLAETWEAGVRNLGSPVRMPDQQHIVRFPCPGVLTFLVRGLPTRRELRHFPRVFQGQSGFVRFHTPMLVGGDFASVQDRLGPFIEAIEASRVWVIGLDDTLVLLSNHEPGAVELERRLALGRAIRDALV